MVADNWNLRIAEADVLNQLRVPRVARQNPKRRSQLVRLLQPQFLIRSRDSILEDLDDEVRESVAGVFFYVPPGSAEPNAIAKTMGRSSRAVAVTQGFMPLMSMTTAIVQSLMPPVQSAAAEVLRRSPKQILPPAEALAFLSTLASDIAHDLTIDGWTASALKSIADSRDDPTALLAGSELLSSLPMEPLSGLILEGGVRFVLGHELAHLLLGHEARRFGPTWDGGQAMLKSKLEGLELSWDDRYTPRAHRDEFEADALGFFLACKSDESDADRSYWRSVETIAGTFAALLSLSLMDERPEGELERTPGSHPPFHERCTRIGEIAHLWSAPNPKPAVFDEFLGREIVGDADAIGMLLWLVIGVMGELIGVE